MTQPKSPWQTGERATAFLTGVRGAIPGANLQLAVIGKIAKLWCQPPANILDLGCGDGILGRFLLDTLPASQGVFVDFSDPMLAEARKSLSAIAGVSFVRADFSTPRWVDAIAPHRPFDIVVSGFAIHHEPDERKKTLYSEIHDLLAPGGIFLNLEHVASFSAAGEQLFDEFFMDHLQDFHSRSDPDISRETIADTYSNRPDKEENILAPVEEQCRWLRDL
jgi:tRNA (cmo5U34)-methyltransferase